MLPGSLHSPILIAYFQHSFHHLGSHSADSPERMAEVSLESFCLFQMVFAMSYRERHVYQSNNGWTLRAKNSIGHESAGVLATQLHFGRELA